MEKNIEKTIYKTIYEWVAKNFGDSEQDFLWVDCFNWQDDNLKDQAVIRAMEQEGIDYCALCWDCVNKLAEKGKTK